MKTRSVPRRFLPWRLVGAVVLMMCALPAYALDYVFPGNLPIGCVDNSGGNYACGALALAADDTVTVAAPTPAKITFSGAFGGGAGVLLNAGSAASNLTLVVNGALTLGAGSTMNATVQTLGAGAVSVGAGSTLSGNISTQTGYVTLGRQYQHADRLCDAGSFSGGFRVCQHARSRVCRAGSLGASGWTHHGPWRRLCHPG